MPKVDIMTAINVDIRCAYKTYAVEGWFPGADVLIEAVAKLGNLSLATMRIRQAVIHQSDAISR